MKRVHVAIYDQSPIIREGLQVILSHISRVNGISVVSGFDELSILLQSEPCHIVLINPTCIQINNAQFQQLKTQGESIRWVGILYNNHPSSLLSKLDYTIDMYESKETLAALLNKWIDSDADEQSQGSRDSLTDREIDVLKLLAEGNSNKEIADKLNISTNTVISHRKNISQKTGIKSVSGLTIYAVTQNLITLDNF